MNIAARYIIVASMAATSAQAMEWQPNRDRYTGTTEQALARYKDHFTAPQLHEIAEMIKHRRWTDQVVIRRDSIDSGNGKTAYLPKIAHMHFGAGKVHAEVSRQSWKHDATQGALVYIPAGSSKGVLLPAVCGNFSIVQTVKPIRQHKPEHNDGGGAIAFPGGPGGHNHPPSWRDHASSDDGHVAPVGPGIRVAQAGINQPELLAFSGVVEDAFSGGSSDATMTMTMPSAPVPVVIIQGPIPEVPEPSTWMLLLCGAALLAAYGRKP